MTHMLRKMKNHTTTADTLPAKIFGMSTNLDEENVLYSFPAIDRFNNENGDIDETMPPLVLELIPLPLLSENFEQMPVGARGWFASALLSAMMISAMDKKSFGNDTGIEFLREDLSRACAAINRTTTSDNNVFLELGSGTIGLAGMTMAWIVAQHRRNNEEIIDSTNSRCTVVLTDYDLACLEQLERNAVGARKRLREYFSTIGFNDDVDEKDNNRNGIVPDIDVVRLDWNEYGQDQSPVFPESNTDNDVDHNSISFACGAALVYTEDTAACADQVAKILRLHPESVVWVLQWPRGGWFSVFQQQLLSQKFVNDNLKIDVKKFGPISSPGMFSLEVQQMALKLMPRAMQQETPMDIRDLRAVRIVNTTTG